MNWVAQSGVCSHLKVKLFIGYWRGYSWRRVKKPAVKERGADVITVQKGFRHSPWRLPLWCSCFSLNLSVFINTNTGYFLTFTHSDSCCVKWVWLGNGLCGKIQNIYPQFAVSTRECLTHCWTVWCALRMKCTHTVMDMYIWTHLSTIHPL